MPRDYIEVQTEESVDKTAGLIMVISFIAIVTVATVWFCWYAMRTQPVQSTTACPDLKSVSIQTYVRFWNQTRYIGELTYSAKSECISLDKIDSAKEAQLEAAWKWIAWYDSLPSALKNN